MIKIRIILCLFLCIFFSNTSYPAKQLDGIDDIGYIVDNDSFAPLTGGFTIMFWVYFNADAALNKNHRIYYQFEDATDHIYINIYPYVDYWIDQIYSNFTFKSAGGEEATGNFLLPIGVNDLRGAWYHFAFIRPENGTDFLYAYINGIKYLSEEPRILNNSINPAIDVTIGNISGDGHIYGILDDYVVLTREVTHRDVFSHMVGRWIPDKDTGIYLPLTEGSGGSFDISPYGNDCRWEGGIGVGGAPILQIK